MAKPLKSVLLATNLQEYNKVAFDVAASIATHYSARLILLHVLEKIPEHIESRLAWLFGDEQRNEILKSQADQARESLVGKNISSAIIRTALQDYCDKSGISMDDTGIPEREIIVTEGNVPESILKFATETESGMIVLATHKGLFTASAVSRVIKEVMKNSTVPVMAVPQAFT